MRLSNLTYDEIILGKAYTGQSLCACGCDISKARFPFEEELLIRFLEEWAKGTRAALDEALAILTGNFAMSDEATREVLQILNSRLGSGFSMAVAEDVRGLIRKSYTFGKAGILLPRQLATSLAIADQGALEWLSEFDLFWIGSYYKRNISELIAGIIQNGMEQGLGRSEIGKDLKNFFDTYPGLASKPDLYWKGMAANGMNRSRNFGMIQGWQEVGIMMLEFVAVMDERTSDVCREMNGRQFPLATAVAQRDALLACGDPEAVKDIAPWPKIEDIRGLTTEAINAKGVVMPPLHFHCRSTVVEKA